MLVAGCGDTSTRSVVPTGYSLGDNGTTVTLYVAHGACDTLRARIVSQDDQQATVEATLTWRTRGTCTANLVLDLVTLTLPQPLGSRAVADVSGAAIPSCMPPTSGEADDSTCWNQQPS